MFDKKFHIDQRGPSHVSVTENRAPTDESVKLLNEMQEAAENNVINSINIGSNTLNGVIVEVVRSQYDLNKTLYIKFNLNGKDYVVLQEISAMSMALDIRETVRILAEKISDSIAHQLLHKAVREIIK